MKLQYLGTAAAEGIPGLFCTCPVCEKARLHGGRNLRTRSQALVDDQLLIDFPPDTYCHVQRGLPLPAITALLLTHAHSDHLYPLDLEMRLPGYAHAGEMQTPLAAPLRIFASAATRRHLEAALPAPFFESEFFVLQTVEPYAPFQVDGYTVTGLKAAHDSATDPLIYLIQREGKTLLYANDTGWFPAETWDYLAATAPKLDFASLDCTFILRDERRGHMGIQANLDTRERLRNLGCATDATLFCHHHFSHNGRLIYDEQVPLAEKVGFLVSYDGMTVTF
jgi:phosphoribosyl 1,2-cyclic phosphate phosphodiesterase